MVQLFSIAFLASIIITTNALAHPDALDVSPRAAFYGGYSLVADPCPAGTASCPSGKCCPENTYCDLVGTSAGYACCPDVNDCAPAVLNAPVCANSSWTLYNGAKDRGYFCCLENQIGTLPGPGQIQVGFCVASDVPVSMTKSATKVAPATVSGSAISGGSSTGSPSASATSKPAASASTTASASAASPSASRAAASMAMSPVDGVFAGVLGALGPMLLAIFL